MKPDRVSLNFLFLEKSKAHCPEAGNRGSMGANNLTFCRVNFKKGTTRK